MSVISVIILIYTFRNEANEPRVGLGAHRTLCKPYCNHLITMAFVSPGSHVHSELIPITLKIWASLLPQSPFYMTAGFSEKELGKIYVMFWVIPIGSLTICSLKGLRVCELTQVQNLGVDSYQHFSVSFCFVLIIRHSDFWIILTKGYLRKSPIYFINKEPIINLTHFQV